MPTVTVDTSSDAPMDQVNSAFNACNQALRNIRPHDASIKIGFEKTGPCGSYEITLKIVSDDFRKPLILKLLPRQAYQMARVIKLAMQDEISAKAATP